MHQISSAWTHNLDPVAFSLGPIPISWYWLFYPLGLGLVFWGSFKHRRALGVHSLPLFEAFAWGWLGVLVGGRLGYALFYNSELFIQHPQALWQIWLGGMSFHGALIGGGLALWLWSRSRKESVLPYSDLILTFVPLGILLGRLGNFINGELYGRVAPVPWGVIFPRAQDGLARHPSQIYEALTEGLLLFLILFLLKGRLWRVRGRATALFFLLYGLFRACSEIFRQPDPQIGFLWLGLTLGQVLSGVMMLIGIGALWTFSKAKTS